MSCSNHNNGRLSLEVESSTDPSGGVSKKMKLDNVYFDDNIASKTYASPKRVVKRKFPGPGGLQLVSSENAELQNSEAFTHEDFHLLCSQQTHLLFEHGLWSEMVKDFSYSSNYGELYEKFSIGWIKSNSGKGKLLAYQKAPFLAAIIDDLEVKGQAVNVTLKDKSGSIKSVVLYDLYKEYKENFIVNSVLVLRQFGVIPIQKDPCITITPKNLLRIYHDEPKSENDSISFKKIVVNDCDINEIWENYHESVRLYPQKLAKQNVRHNIPSLPHVNHSRNTTNISNTSVQCKTTTVPQQKTYTFRNTSTSVADIKNVTFGNTSTSVTDIKNVVREEVKNETVHCDKDPREEVKDSKIWGDFFQDVDVNSLFDDF